MVELQIWALTFFSGNTVDRVRILHTWDTDQLQLHGKNGITFTTQGQGSFVGMRLQSDGTLRVRRSVFTNQSSLSDQRLKENIRNITNALPIIRRLQGVRFDFKIDQAEAAMMDKLESMQATNEKEQAAKDRTMRDIKGNWQAGKNKFGFTAQQVQRVAPDLVSKTEDEYLTVDYVAVVPILVEAMKEQQRQIEVMQRQIEELERKIK